LRPALAPTDSPSPFRLVQGGLAIAVRLSPKASRNAITGVDNVADGGCCLKARVTAVPENGRANAALVKLLAKEWRLAAGRVTVVSGSASRHKQILIADGDAELKAKLENWLEDRLKTPT
jgi:uncharacterized protein (TIGR00251 family)